MKTKKLKLKFIEAGRMSKDELNVLYGGWWTCCDTVIYCGEDSTYSINKNSCTNYENCTNNESLNSCGSYTWLRVFDNSEQKKQSIANNLNK